MSNVYITIFFLFFFISSCRPQPNGFVNHEKWILESSANRAKIKSHPISVEESQYSNLNDTIFSDKLKGKFNGTWNYKFDTDGNIVSGNFFLDSNFSSDFFYRTDVDGQQYEYLGYLKNDTSRSYVKSKKMTANKFKRETYRNGEKRFSEIWVFENEGQIVAKERYFNDTIGFIVKEFYEDGLLKRSTKSEKFLSSEDIYYYSKNNYLDSMVAFVKNIPVFKFIYLNNDNGDPIYYEELFSGEVKKRRWMKYRYDDKGNWIEMLQRDEEQNNFNGFADNERYPEFRLVKRQIKY